MSSKDFGRQTFFGPCMTKTLWVKFKPVANTLAMIEREFGAIIDVSKEYEVVMALGDKMVVDVDGAAVDIYPRHVTIVRSETLRVNVEVLESSDLEK